MRYTGEICPVCQKPFTDEDDVVVCPECGTPHHRACYEAEAHCFNAEKHGTDFAWTPSHTQTDAPVSALQAAPKAAPPVEQKDGHNIVFCPQCGAENNAEEPLCKQCGARLYNNAGGQTPPSVNLPNGSQLYGMPQTVVIPPTETIGGNTVSDTAEYVQMGARKYIPKFFVMEKQHKKVSWNWAAFFFAPYWYFYRKMYAFGAVLMAFLLLAGGLCTTPRYIEKSAAFMDAVEATAMQGVTEENADAASPDYIKAYKELVRLPEFILGALAQIGVALFSGLYANYFYKRKAAKDIQRLKSQASTPEQYRILLFRRGGVSVFMCILSFWIYELASQLIAFAISKFLL